jgi:hypothetical protein
MDKVLTPSICLNQANRDEGFKNSVTSQISGDTSCDAVLVL